MDDKDKISEMLGKDTSYSDIEDDTADLIEAISDMKIMKDEGGKRNMCKAWIDQREEGRKEGKEEGRKEGRTDGRKEGMERINALNNLLILNDRIEDLKRAAVDWEYQKKLLMEFFPDEAGTATA